MPVNYGAWNAPATFGNAFMGAYQQAQADKAKRSEAEMDKQLKQAQIGKLEAQKNAPAYTFGQVDPRARGTALENVPVDTSRVPVVAQGYYGAEQRKMELPTEQNKMLQNWSASAKQLPSLIKSYKESAKQPQALRTAKALTSNLPGDIGKLIAPDVAEYEAKVFPIIDPIMRAATGAAISPGELPRYTGMFPKYNDPASVAKTRLDAFFNALDQKNESVAQTQEAEGKMNSARAVRLSWQKVKNSPEMKAVYNAFDVPEESGKTLSGEGWEVLPPEGE